MFTAACMMGYATSSCICISNLNEYASMFMRFNRVTPHCFDISIPGQRVVRKDLFLVLTLGSASHRAVQGNQEG